MIDIFVLEFMNNISNPLFDNVMPFITKQGDKGLIWILLALIMLYYKQTRTYGIAIIMALLLTLVLGEGIIKNIIQRDRPFIKHSFDVIINHPISYSFPSGHTASSFTVLGIFLFGIKKYRFSCFILAFLIAFSRLYLGVHYFTDVLGGAVLGLVDAYLVYRLYLRKQLQT